MATTKSRPGFSGGNPRPSVARRKEKKKKKAIRRTELAEAKKKGTAATEERIKKSKTFKVGTDIHGKGGREVTLEQRKKELSDQNRARRIEKFASQGLISEEKAERELKNIGAVIETVPTETLLTKGEVMPESEEEVVEAPEEIEEEKLGFVDKVKSNLEKTGITKGGSLLEGFKSDLGETWKNREALFDRAFIFAPAFSQAAAGSLKVGGEAIKIGGKVNKFGEAIRDGRAVITHMRKFKIPEKEARRALEVLKSKDANWVMKLLSKKPSEVPIWVYGAAGLGVTGVGIALTAAQLNSNMVWMAIDNIIGGASMFSRDVKWAAKENPKIRDKALEDLQMTMGMIDMAKDFASNSSEYNPYLMAYSEDISNAASMGKMTVQAQIDQIEGFVSEEVSALADSIIE